MKKIIIIVLLHSIVIIPFSHVIASNEPKIWQTHYEVDESALWKAFEKNMDGTEGWKLLKKKDDITIYTRKVEISPVKAFRGVMRIESDLSKLNTFFVDAEYFPDWVGLCVFSEYVKIGDNPFDKYFYAIVQPPWPVKSRDAVAHCILEQDPETLATTIKLIGVPQYCPSSKEHVRCPLLLLMMKTIPIGDGMVEIWYEVVVEVGGWVPDWVISFCLKYAPSVTLKKTREMLPEIKERYKDVVYDVITEPFLSKL